MFTHRYFMDATPVACILILVWPMEKLLSSTYEFILEMHL